MGPRPHVPPQHRGGGDSGESFPFYLARVHPLHLSPPGAVDPPPSPPGCPGFVRWGCPLGSARRLEAANALLARQPGVTFSQRKPHHGGGGRPAGPPPSLGSLESPCRQREEAEAALRAEERRCDEREQRLEEVCPPRRGALKRRVAFGVAVGRLGGPREGLKEVCCEGFFKEKFLLGPLFKWQVEKVLSFFLIESVLLMPRI